MSLTCVENTIALVYTVLQLEFVNCACREFTVNK